MHLSTLIKRFVVCLPGIIAVIVGGETGIRLYSLVGIIYLVVAGILLKKFATNKDRQSELAVKKGIVDTVDFVADPKKNILQPLEKAVAKKLINLIEKHKDDGNKAS